MRTENQKMKTFLKENGIEATPRYLSTGSCKGRWMIYNAKISWYENHELQNKMNQLGFTDFDKKPLHKFSGNGGRFSICAFAPQEINSLCLSSYKTSNPSSL